MKHFLDEKSLKLNVLHSCLFRMLSEKVLIIAYCLWWTQIFYR